MEFSIEGIELEAKNKACDSNGLTIEYVIFSHPYYTQTLEKFI